jgi:hypothetical protein
MSNYLGNADSEMSSPSLLTGGCRINPCHLNGYEYDPGIHS